MVYAFISENCGLFCADFDWFRPVWGLVFVCTDFWVLFFVNNKQRRPPPPSRGLITCRRGQRGRLQRVLGHSGVAIGPNTSSAQLSFLESWEGVLKSAHPRDSLILLTSMLMLAAIPGGAWLGRITPTSEPERCSLAELLCSLWIGDAVKLKKESYWAFLACGNPEAAARYQQAKRCAAASEEGEAVHCQHCVQLGWCAVDLDQECCESVEGILRRPP